MVADADGEVAAAEEQADAAANAQQQMLAQFEAALREQDDLGEEGYEFLMGHLREAVENVSLEPEVVELDRTSWISTFDALVGEDMDEGDRNALIRQLNDAVDPLDSSGVQIATEFAKRLQSQGEASALMWLQEQRRLAEAETNSPNPAPDQNGVPQAQSITRSRSRRLRGPPG